MNAVQRGHTVYCVTMRTPAEGEEVRRDLAQKVKAIYFTSRKNKHDFMFEQLISIDVWIDDMPFFIMNDAKS
jgi:myo-inositol catabolism protein IolC